VDTLIRRTNKILGSLVFLCSLALPAKAGPFVFYRNCQHTPYGPFVDTCVDAPYGGYPDSPIDLSLTVTSGGGVVTSSIQGTMSFFLPGGNSRIDIFTRQWIVPQPGGVSWSAQWTALVWADQPVSSNLMVEDQTCGSFPSEQDCGGLFGLVPIPYLGTDPDLGSVPHVFSAEGGEVFRPPDMTLPPGAWENTLTLFFINSSGSDHVRIVIANANATFRNGVLAPEPATLAEFGIGFGFILGIAHRERRLSQSRPTAR
jgi:hypothetical protein